MNTGNLDSNRTYGPLHGQDTRYGSSPVKRHRRTNDDLDTIDDLIVEAIAQDAPVTLRGVFYRVSSAGGVPKDENGYRVIGRQLLKLRRAGRVAYSAITDGTRYILRPTTYPGLMGMLSEVHASYRRQLWANQAAEVHVFAEKDAISGVLSPVTDEFDVPLAIVRGYASESFAYSLAQAVAAAHKPVFIYQFGDHDPSGIDAWRDLQRKVSAFAPAADVTFERVAVTPGQIADMDLPTRPTKTTDTRARGFDGRSVEVDAIPARVLRRILRDRIEAHIDQRQLAATRYAEDTELEQIAGIMATIGGQS